MLLNYYGVLKVVFREEIKQLQCYVRVYTKETYLWL